MKKVYEAPEFLSEDVLEDVTITSGNDNTTTFELAGEDTEDTFRLD